MHDVCASGTFLVSELILVDVRSYVVVAIAPDDRVIVKSE